jgi:hypothetical protein
MHLGLDVGTGTTKLTRYAGEAGEDSRMLIVPTAVLYRGLAGQIPAFAPDGEPGPDVLRCDGFPAVLGARPPARVAAWGGRTAAEVTQSFLRHLLLRAGGEEGPESGSLVVTVPAVGAHPAAGERARDGGRELVEILGALGRPPRRVLPAPIAALAYLLRERPDLSEVTRFAVCDIGAGGMSFALCVAAESGARIVDVVRVPGSAVWRDRDAEDGPPVTLTERLAAQIARAGGAAADLPGGGRSVLRWRTLEAALASQDDSGLDLQRVFGVRGRYPGFGLLRFADVEVTVAQVHDACAPLAAAAEAALTGLLARQPDPGWHHIGAGTPARIVPIGGLSGLRPIRDALLRAAGLDPRDPPVETALVETEARLYAAALGAAFVAAGKSDPSVRYPWGLRLPVHRMVRDRIEPSYLELAAAGSIAPDQAETPVKGPDGAPVVVTVPASREAMPLTAPLPVQLVPADGTEPVAAQIQPAQFKPALLPLPGEYRISVAGDPGGAAIVLRSVTEDRTLRYVLRQPAPAGGTG